jgi:hypothetical protein
MATTDRIRRGRARLHNGPELLHTIDLDDGTRLVVQVLSGGTVAGAEFDEEVLVASFKALGDRLVNSADLVEKIPDAPDTMGELVSNSTAALLDAVRREEELYTKVPFRRKQTVTRSLNRLAGLLSEAAQEKGVSERELERQAQIATDAFQVITRGSAAQLATLVRFLEPLTPDDPSEISEDEAEVLGRLRIEAMNARLEAETYGVRDLERRFSRQRLKQLRDEERLFAFALPRLPSLRYPKWQFIGTEPRQEMQELVPAAKEHGLDPISFHSLMTRPYDGDGEPAFKLLDLSRHDLVLNLIGTASEHGS